MKIRFCGNRSIGSTLIQAHIFPFFQIHFINSFCIYSPYLGQGYNFIILLYWTVYSHFNTRFVVCAFESLQTQFPFCFVGLLEFFFLSAIYCIYTSTDIYFHHVNIFPLQLNLLYKGVAVIDLPVLLDAIIIIMYSMQI